MGFPDAQFNLGEPKQKSVLFRDAATATSGREHAGGGGGEYPAVNVWFKQHYRMLGNAVCPPVICALASSVLHHCRGMLPPPPPPSVEEVGVVGVDWEDLGLSAAVQLAMGAVAPHRRQAVWDRLQETLRK